MARFLLKPALLTTAILLGHGTLAPALANSHTSAQTQSNACVTDLERARAELATIAADMRRDGVTEQTLSRLLGWKDAFAVKVEEHDLGDALTGAGIGVGSSVLAAVMLGGPPGWLAATLAAAIGGAVSEGLNTVMIVNSWAEVDDNTAFYQYMLDYLEYGRVGSIDDDNLRRFITNHANQLQQLTGSAPPANPQQLHRYLQAHSERLMLFFGFFEQRMGADSFPRWKFPATQGRFGHDRLAVGYFGKLLGGRLARQIGILDQEITRLEKTGCTDETVDAIPACGSVPAVDASQACLCDLTDPGTVWGTDLYTSDSDICTAALHSGLLRAVRRGDGSYGYAGLVDIRGQQGCPEYTGSTSHGVRTEDYGSWGGSFYFPAAQRGLCDEASPPARGAWYCPAKIGSQTDLTCHCAPSTFGDGHVWGTQYYTDDSTICRAARHNGSVGSRGGTVRVIELGGLDEYTGSTSNGIETKDWGAWGRSFGFP